MNNSVLSLTAQSNTDYNFPQNDSVQAVQLSPPGYPDQSEQEHLKTNAKMWTSSSVICDLQQVLVHYHGQPEILRLVLRSKIEEDKRKTEEARLRAREVELLLLHHQRFTTASMIMETSTQVGSVFVSQTPSVFIDAQQQQSALYQRRPSIQGSSDSPGPLNAAIESSFVAVGDRVVKDCTSTAMSSASFSSPASSFPMATQFVPAMDHSTMYTHSHSSSESSSLECTKAMAMEANNPHLALPQQQSTVRKICETSSRIQQQSIRRRREMQAITKIVVTHDHPYLDGYIWKNNGNTIQKKTGNKSTYYKCTNSNKGCPVNKTVTCRESGGYLIKYRGEHLLECSRGQRIVNG